LADLARKRDRERLEPRREPYWQRLGAGAQLGFRRGPDTWVAKYRSRDGKRHLKALGEALDYDEAKRRAEEWLDKMGSAVRSVKRATVRAALAAYLTDLERHGRADAAREARWRFKVTVYEDAFADLELEELTRDDVLEWRDRVRKGREPRTVNRYVRAVVAGLNAAVELGHVGNPSAWRVRPLADDVEDEGNTAVFLTAAQRKALIAAADPYTAAFLKALEHTGARPHEMAAALVRDFDGETLRLAHRKGKPPKLRARHVVLGADGVTFFRGLAKDRLPAAPLLTEDGEYPWRRHIWCKQIRAAIAAHNKDAKGKDRLPAIGAYVMRHARISELLQLHGVDPLTVAAQTGTSLAMIEKVYHKFIPGAMRDKLAAVRGSAL
jgi:integrase